MNLFYSFFDEWKKKIFDSGLRLKDIFIYDILIWIYMKFISILMSYLMYVFFDLFLFVILLI